MSRHSTLNSTRKDLFITAGLLLLCLVPIIGGVLRLSQLSGPPIATDANARFLASPAPIIIHVISSLFFSVIGAFQFNGAVRRIWPKWHRFVGRLLVPAGLLSALSGVWMTQFYPNPPGDGLVLYGIRMIVGILMTISIVKSVVAIQHGNVTSHSAWMTRAYALGMGAGTQVITHLPWFIFVGEAPTQLPRAIMMGAGWALNMLIAESVIAKSKKYPTK
jgi:uncharacterized membrane protein